MVRPTELEELRETLRRKRREIFETRLGIDSSWKDLHEPEIEPEEQAQKEKMALGLDQLDSQEKEAIESIDMALHRIASGNYGICLECGKDIDIKRLRAIPWARRCIRCANQDEPRKPGEPELILNAQEHTPYAGYSDEELEESIWEELHDDGRVDTEELEISCEDGTVNLTGAVPSHKEHAVLMEILEDVMGLEDIVDNLRIEHVSWERRDRTSDGDDDDDESIILNQDDDDMDGWDPPEEFVPEKE